MDFLINDGELAALCGLSHLQQLAYLRGIRPYMDVKTGLVGVKRRISHQSIAEQLYVEPHQGTKSQSFSRDQVRRSIAGLVRAGIVSVQSESMHLILKCELATAHYCVQNKAAINPPQKGAINLTEISLVNTGLSEIELLKADIVEPQKAAIPLKEDNYIYLLSQFEKFWSLYPEKKSKQNAWEIFQSLQPSDTLFRNILNALQHQIQERIAKEAQGIWAPPWKYPANWLAKRAFEDEVPFNKTKEKQDAKHWKSNQPQSRKDMFACDFESIEGESDTRDNIIPFKRVP